MNNFVKRTLSAIVYAGLVLTSILVQPQCFGGHPLLFGILFLILSTRPAYTIAERVRLTKLFIIVNYFLNNLQR